MSRVPKAAEAILSAILPAESRDEVLGDLAEAHARRAERSPIGANVWYLTQLVAVPAWLLWDALAAIRFDRAEAGRTLRGLVRNPGFTLLAVASLGLGIGATTAIAGALQALLFETLPVESPEELSLVYHTWPEQWGGGQYGSSSSTDPSDGASVVSNVSYPAYTQVRAAAPTGVELAAYAFVQELAVVSGDQPAIAGGGMLVSGNYFSTLRLGTEIGRPLIESDDDPSAERVAVLSHSFWQRAFAGDPGVLDRSLELNGELFRIVGVARKGYLGLSPGGFFSPSDVIVPLSVQPVLLSSLPGGAAGVATVTDVHWIRLLARVEGGIPWGPLQESLSVQLADHLVEVGVIAEGDAGDVEVRFLEGARGLDSLRTSAEGPLRILSVVVALVLLIACANLATLLLARGAARAPDFALRRAIGASRWELLRPQLVESLLLGLAGSAVGLVVALRGGPLLVSALTDGAGRAAVRYEMSWPLVATCVCAGLVAALVSGGIPALRVLRIDPARGLGGRSQGGSGARFPLGRVLIAGQIAVSIPLVVGAGLFLRTMGNLQEIDPGFDPSGLSVFRVDAALVSRDPDRQSAIYAEILDEIQQAAPVTSAAIVGNVLLSGWRSNGSVQIDDEEARMEWNYSSPEFFATMGIPVLSGRALARTDGAGAPPVAVVNETAERTLFGGRAIGRRIQLGSRELEIVGVVGDTKYASLRSEVQPTFFAPYVQRNRPRSVHYVVRSEQPPAVVERTVRSVVSRADPGLPVTAFRSQGDDIESAVARERVFARLLTLFGGFALLLSCIGLHGITAFTVSRRTAEMGVRLALGAAPSGIVRLVLRQVVGVTAVGLVLGIIASRLTAPVVDSMVFGVEATDPGMLLVAAVLMTVVAAAAGWLPARRAAKVDPVVALSEGASP